MFPESRIPPNLLLLLGCLLFTAGEEAVRLQELEGNTVTIHTGLTEVQNDAKILWFYGPEKAEMQIVISSQGGGDTGYDRHRFKDRLKLDRSSGSLTIRSISREDSGEYRLKITRGTTSVWRFSVKVYARVSKPGIKEQGRKRFGASSQSCSPQCSVEGGEDVSLTWYKGNETISSISSTGSSECLYLLLNNITFPCGCNYTCVAANPVSSQKVPLDIAEICALQRGLGSHAAVLIPVGLTVTALSLIPLVLF